MNRFFKKMTNVWQQLIIFNVSNTARFARGRTFGNVSSNFARGDPVLGVIGAPLLPILRAPYCEVFPTF